MSKLMTFHKTLPGCEQGDPEAWKAFLTDYSSTGLSLLSVYSPWAPEARWEAWRGALRTLSADNCAALRAFSHQSEREFLVDLRAFLQDWIATKLEPQPHAVDPPAPTVQALDGLLKGLPVVHQEIVFLTLSGYSQSTLEKMLRVPPAVAGEGLARLRSSYPGVLERNEDRCLWPAAWLAICAAARGGGQKDCTSLRQLIRILDGQASWYEKSPAEEHRGQCLHCLELWASLLEVVALSRVSQAWPAEKIANLLAAVTVKPEKPKPSLFGRMLGKSN
jgi:hypothetical protein